MILKLNIKQLLGILSFFTISNIIVIGQDKSFGLSINPKIGIYNWTSANGGIISGEEAYIFKNKIIYSLNLYAGKEFEVYGSPTPNEYFRSIDIMIGKYIGDGYFRFEYQGGFSLFWGKKRTELIKKSTGIFASEIYNSKDFYTIGIPLKLGFKIIPLEYFSVGIDLQANINLENPIYMPMLSIEFGKLRNKIN